MMRPLLLVVLLTQTAPLSRFEVASIHPSPSAPSAPVGLRITAGHVRFSFLSLQDYIGIAYGVHAYQIVGPGWLASARFEITAKFPDDPDASKHLPEMLRALLEDRFKMRTHRESREFPVYALEVAPKGPPLVRVPEEAQSRSTVAAGFATSPGMLHNLDAASTAAIPDALERVGLLLRRRRAPLDVLVVDAVEKPPREN